MEEAPARQGLPAASPAPLRPPALADLGYLAANQVSLSTSRSE